MINAHIIKTLANIERDKKILQVLLNNVLEATDIQRENKVDKLNVNEHLFSVKKGKIWNIFKFIQ